MDARSPWFSVAFLFFAILAFNPLRDRMQALVDRLFDRDHSLYRRAVREISEAMVSMLSTREVVDRILVALTETMGVERAMVMLQEDGGRRLAPAATRGEWEDDALGIQIALDHPICRKLLSRRDALARDDFDEDPDLEVREACRDVFDQLEVELFVPILFGAELLGVVAVGRKISGDRFGADDRQLLRTLANQSSIAIENAKAFDEIADLNATLEARVDDRTRELHQAQAQLVHGEKMRSLGQLVAGVAHELNNPIGFVHANLQLLSEYVPKLVAAQRAGDDTTRIENAIEKLLSRSREGTERVKQIVADLRTFSRMDHAVLSEVDLNREIDRALTLMEPRLRDAVEVMREYGEIPLVSCYAGQLNQVFTNLLMNAADAMDGKGTIRIRTFAKASAGFGSHRLRPHRVPRRRSRHVARGAGAHLRAVLHDQARRAGHRARTLDLVRDRRAPRRSHAGGIGAGRGDDLRDRVAAGRETTRRCRPGGGPMSGVATAVPARDAGSGLHVGGLRAGVLPARDALPRRLDDARLDQQHPGPCRHDLGRARGQGGRRQVRATNSSRSTGSRICVGVATEYWRDLVPGRTNLYRFRESRR